MNSPDVIIQLFKQNSLKITPQRRLIIELLAQDDSHPTTDTLYQRVISRMPDVSQTTVYNTLRELVSLGELAPVGKPGEAGARFDTNTSHHHHLFCIHCQTLTDIKRDFPEVELTQEEAKGYQITKNQVTFYGVCPECQKT